MKSRKDSGFTRKQMERFYGLSPVLKPVNTQSLAAQFLCIFSEYHSQECVPSLAAKTR